MSVSRKSLISSLLAGGLLVSLIGATPANAAPTIALSINGVVISNANVASSPASVTVPADNSVDAVDAVRFYLTGVDAGTTVTVAATNAFIVPVLTTTLNPVRSNAGVASANYSVGTGTTSEFFAYTRSTALGTITISNGGSTFTYYIRGTAGPAYTIAYTPNAKPFTSTLVKQSVKVTDAFGNPVVGITPALALINIVSTTPTATAADGTSEFTLTYPATAGRIALSVSITAMDVTGYVPAVKAVSTFIDVVDPTGEIADATAALAAEKAARAADKASSDALLAAEKAARAAEKTAAETTRAAEKTASDAVLNAEKAARAADKTAADKALADEKAARAADKTASDKALATLTARVATLTKQVADLKALYNKLAVKFKQKTIK